MFFLWLALNVFYVLKALNPPEWLVDEGKKRRCEERDPPGLVTPIYWPGDPHRPASLAVGHLPRGHIARPLETAALWFCTAHALGEHAPRFPHCPHTC